MSIVYDLISNRTILYYSKKIFADNQKRIAIKLPVTRSLPKPTVSNVNENVCRKVGMLYVNWPKRPEVYDGVIPIVALNNVGGR